MAARVGRWAIRREFDYPPEPLQARLSDIAELRRWLRKLSEEGDSNFFLENEETGVEITVLMKAPVSVVIVREAEGEPWSASMDKSFGARSDRDWTTFRLGSTPTHIPNDRCLPFETMQKVIEHFYEFNSRPSWIAWRYD